jgi:hypothetical protein
MSNKIEIDLDGPGLDNEQFYDEVLAPALLRISQELESRGLAFLCTAEYNPGEFGTTLNNPATKCDATRMGYYAIRSHGNIDSVAIQWVREAREQKRAHGSIVMNQMGLDPDPAKR